MKLPRKFRYGTMHWFVDRTESPKHFIVCSSIVLTPEGQQKQLVTYREVNTHTFEFYQVPRRVLSNVIQLLTREMNAMLGEENGK